MKEKRYEIVELFAFRLNQTSAVILFIFVLTTLLGYITTIYGYFLDLFRVLPIPAMSELISFLIKIVLGLIPLPISIYILITCLKLRTNDSNNENKDVTCFGFELNSTSAIVLFFMSLIGIIGFAIGIFGTISIIILDILWDLTGILTIIIPYILLLIEAVIILLIYLWIMQRSIIILKKTKEEKERTKIDNVNKAKIFGFELNETSGSIVFLRALVAIVGYISIIFIYVSDFSPNLLFLIVPSIFLGLYIYPMICCLRLKNIDINNKKEGIDWFGFKINNTSACILYVMSILGILGALSRIFNFVNPVIIGLSFTDNLFELFGYLLYFMGFLIEGIVLLMIYIYTFRKSAEIRKILL